MAIEGKVASVLNERELTFNKGGEGGVIVGMIFKVVEPPFEIIDPDTKLVLGRLSREKVRIKVLEVYPNFSVGRTFETYETLDGPFIPGLIATMTPRRVTKVRTLRTTEKHISQLDQAAVSVAVGDIVVEVSEEARARI